MNSLRMVMVAVWLVAGCGGGDDDTSDDDSTVDASAAGDAPATPDGGRLDGAGGDGAPAPADLSCLDEAPSAVADDPIMISGLVLSVVDYQASPRSGAMVSLLGRGDKGLLTQTQSGIDGRFSMLIETFGEPVDAFLQVNSGDDPSTRLFFEGPITRNRDVLAVVAGATEVAAWYTAAGDTFDAGKRTVLAVTYDCVDNVIGPAAVDVTPPPARLIYYNDDLQVWDPTLEMGTNGYALATSTAADVTVVGHAGAVDLPPHDVAVTTGTLTIATITPRQ